MKTHSDRTLASPSPEQKSSGSRSRQSVQPRRFSPDVAVVQRLTEARVAASRQDTEANFSKAFSPSRQDGLPVQLKSGIERLSGMAMDDVNVHYNSSKPAQLQALAYAQGNSIYVGPGQEANLPHEAWHVVQQKQGRVQATTQLKGMSVNTNAGLEHEADVMGERALQAARSNSTGVPRAVGIQGRPGLSGGIAQCQNAPVIQARWIKAHKNAKVNVKVREDDTYRRNVETNFMEFNYDPRKYPHIQPSALRAYEDSVNEDYAQDLPKQRVYEDIKPAKSYDFAENESYSFYSIHISYGDYLVTFSPRYPDLWNGRFQEAQKILGQHANGNMGEEDVQHVSTHNPGTPKGANHRHYFFANGVNRIDLGRAVTLMEDEGLIGKPRVSPRGVPYKQGQKPRENELNELEVDYDRMKDSYEVGKKVRLALELPVRQDRVEIEEFIHRYEQRQKNKNPPKDPKKNPKKNPEENKE